MKSRVLFCACLAFFALGAQAQESTEVICSYAPSQQPIVNRITGMISGAAVGTEAVLLASGLSVVAHSSGASILTGSAGYIAGSMSGAVVATTLVTAGVLIGGTVITVELACAPKNHSELVEEVLDGAKEYGNAGVRALNTVVEQGRRLKESVEDKVYSMLGETWYERAFRKSKAALGI